MACHICQLLENDARNGPGTLRRHEPYLLFNSSNVRVSSTIAEALDKLEGGSVSSIADVIKRVR